LQLHRADREPLIIFDMNVHVRGRRPAVHHYSGTRQVAKVETGSAVVRVGVCVDDEIQLQLPVSEKSEVTVYLFSKRVHQGGFAAILAGDKIGFTFAVIELLEEHSNASLVLSTASLQSHEDRPSGLSF
jgi:hypothetical protein